MNGWKKVRASTQQLVDNKRKHLEKPLSAAKRDQVLLRAAHEDMELKKKHLEQMQQTQESFNTVAQSTSSSLQSLGKGISDGLG